MKNLKHAFIVSKTFEEVTPESAEQGMPSADGFVFDRTEMSAEDLIKEIDSIGVYEFNTCPRDLSSGYVSLYQIEPETDYRTATEYREAIHIETHPALLADLFARIDAKNKGDCK